MVGERQCRAGVSRVRLLNIGGRIVKGIFDWKGRDPAGDSYRGEGFVGDPPPEGRVLQGIYTEHTQT